MAVQRDNPYGNYNFVVDLGGGKEEAGFSEVDLPAGEIEAIEYREGSDKVSSARKLPGRVSYPNVVLSAGLPAGWSCSSGGRQSATATSTGAT